MIAGLVAMPIVDRSRLVLASQPASSKHMAFPVGGREAERGMQRGELLGEVSNAMFTTTSQD